MDAFLKVIYNIIVHIQLPGMSPSTRDLLQGFSDLITLPLIKVFDERELEVQTHI